MAQWLSNHSGRLKHSFILSAVISHCLPIHSNSGPNVEKMDSLVFVSVILSCLWNRFCCHFKRVLANSAIYLSPWAQQQMGEISLESFCQAALWQRVFAILTEILQSFLSEFPQCFQEQNTFCQKALYGSMYVF